MHSQPEPRRLDSSATLLAITVLIAAVQGQQGRLPVPPAPPVSEALIVRSSAPAHGAFGSHGGAEAIRVPVLPRSRRSRTGAAGTLEDEPRPGVAREARSDGSRRGSGRAGRIPRRALQPQGHERDTGAKGAHERETRDGAAEAETVAESQDQPATLTAGEALGIRVSADFVDSPIEEILRCFELEAGRSFLLERRVSRLLREKRPSGSLQCDDTSLASALDRLLRPLGIAVALRDDEVLLVARGRLPSVEVAASDSAARPSMQPAAAAASRRAAPASARGRGAPPPGRRPRLAGATRP